MKRLSIIGALVLILAACGGGEEEGVTLKPVGISREEAQVASAGLADTFDGLMVFVKGNGLYTYDAASGQDPVFVTDDLDPWTISAAPSRDKLVFETGDYDDGQIQVLDAATRTARAVPVQLSSRAAETWGVAGWSPDEQWIISFLWPIGQEAVRLDDGAGYILAESTDTLTTWLADGSVLIVNRDFSGFGGGNVVYRGVSRVDLTTGQTEIWDADPDALAQNLGAALQNLLDEHGQALADPESVWGGDVNIIPPENFYSFQAAAPLCESWIFARNEPVAEGETPEVLFESEGTYRITDFQVLEDGSWLYLKWTLPDCRISAMPVIALIHQTPGGEPRIITDDMFSEIDYSRRALNLGDTGRFMLSVDQTRILWAGGNAEAGESTLNITDLATGDTQTILTEQRGTLSAEAFAANQMIRAAYWLAVTE